MVKLSGLRPGESAAVKNINATGALRRRFFDIGIIEGTRIKCVAVSPQKDPKAFDIRGAVIAIRDSDSALIEVGDSDE